MSEEPQPVLDQPARGTRPANRRALIIAAAADLYSRNGYSKTAMKDVADAVAIGPSALYRHFSSKQELLYAVVYETVTTVDAMLDGLLADPTTDMATTLAGTVLQHRGIGVLWHTEARHLGETARGELRHQLRNIGAKLADILQRLRPDLDQDQADFLSWCVLGITTSVSYHRLHLPGDRLTELIATITRAATSVPLPPFRSAPETEPESSWSPSRREAILTAATRLFAQRGFAGVGTEDIGAAIGIAGPSIYNHFDSKADILAAAMRRGNELLRADVVRQLARAHGPADAVRRLIASHCDFAFENSDLIRLLTSETDQLPPHERHRTRTAQHDYIAEWSQLLRQVHPRWDPVETRIRIQATLIVVNDIVATPHLHALDNIDGQTAAVCRRLLEVA